MTVTASQIGTAVTIVNDAPVATVVVNESFLQRGSRGIASWVKRRLGLGPNGQYGDTETLVKTVRTNIVPIVVPDVVGMTRVNAIALLTANDLVLGTVTNSDDPVVSQSPIAGADAVYLDSVNLTMTV